MARLPDFEGLAIFAKVVEVRSFAGAAAELKLSKATVSKAVSRIEGRLGARLINRTSRRLALTNAGRQLVGRAAHILAEGQAAEDSARAQATMPRGLVRLAAPMSFGLLHVAPLLPEFLASFPEVSIDLHLSDAQADLIGEGFDAAIRIAVMPDSSLVARRLCEMPRYLVGSPAYLKRYGRPKHPLDLAQHRCIGYSHAMSAEAWRFTKEGKSATVRPSGPLRVKQWRRDDARPARWHGAQHSPRVYFARGTPRWPAREIAVGLVPPTWRRSLGDTVRGAATKARRSPRQLSCWQTWRPSETRTDGRTREQAIIVSAAANEAFGQIPDN
jgi:DNA-binding transcriptional LysR family regulator